MSLNKLKIDKSWTLFLDRDGVINRKLPDDYVKKISEFSFISGAVEAIAELTSLFGRCVVVTNQQGIGKQLMNEDDLEHVHDHMLGMIQKKGGKIDKIYYCPELHSNNHIDRKPNTGMAIKAKKDFPEIDFEKSIMVGDSLTDIQFGESMGMKTVFVSGQSNIKDDILSRADYIVSDLKQLANRLKSN